jgi:hypothetical protein
MNEQMDAARGDTGSMEGDGMMATSKAFDRRSVLGLMASGAAMLATGARADALPHVLVYRNPTCGCCHKWIEHLIANGFGVTVRDAPSLTPIRQALGVPAELAACHTAQVGGYVVEGHVPAVAIKRLLSEKPEARGLAVPGMPIGSPGMEGGEPETYDVILFGAGGQLSYGRFREDKAV